MELTTGQVAKLLCISNASVIKCCENGYLPFWKIPNSTHRRINAYSLLEFAKSNNMDHCIENIENHIANGRNSKSS